MTLDEVIEFAQKFCKVNTERDCATTMFQIFPLDKTKVIYLGQESDEELKMAVFHELGHLIDFESRTSAELFNIGNYYRNLSKKCIDYELIAWKFAKDFVDTLEVEFPNWEAYKQEALSTYYLACVN